MNNTIVQVPEIKQTKNLFKFKRDPKERLVCPTCGSLAQKARSACFSHSCGGSKTDSYLESSSRITTYGTTKKNRYNVTYDVVTESCSICGAIKKTESRMRGSCADYMADY